ncbi:MAG: M56 family metallopeptidase [Phycisphaerae bacterium]
MISSLLAMPIHDLANGVLSWVGLALLYGSALAVVTWLLTKTLLRHTPPAVQGCLWLIVLIKFVFPLGPASSYSLATTVSLFGGLWPASATSFTAPHAAEAPDGELRLVPTVYNADDATTATPVAEDRGVPLITLVAFAYLGAVVLIGVWRLRRYALFAVACRRLPEVDARSAQLVSAVCTRVGVRRVLDVRMSEQAPAPFLFGILQPTLVLSRRQLDRPEELEAVVLHELAHLRRGDLLVRYLQWLAGTMLFFWPVVAWVNRRIDLAREQACDEWALRHGRLSAGDYARTLLRALHPTPMRWSAHVPCAMAAHRSHVQRRIEMIMSTSSRRGFARSLGFGGAALIAAWGGFALTGQAQQSDQAGAPTETREVIVQVDGNPDGAPPPVLLLDADAPAWFGLDCGELPEGADFLAFVHCDEDVDADGERRHLAMQVVAPPGKKQLAEFLTKYPAADANADGVLTANERDAYLVALALSDPAAVLAKYPNADRDKNGALSALEAARLVQGANLHDTLKPQIARRVMLKDAPAGAAGTWTPQHENVEVRVRASADGSPDQVHVEKIVNGQPVEVKPEEMRMFTRRLPPPDLAYRWLLENVSASLTSADVARQLAVVQEAPLVTFLELNPKADANGDGKLTAEERDTFVEQNASRMRQKLLEKIPAADANGDGILTNDELREFHKSNGLMGAAGAPRVIMRKAEANGDTPKVVVELEHAGGGDR